MTPRQKQLKLVSFAVMALGLIGLVGGVLLLFSSPLFVALSVPVSSDVSSLPVPAVFVGVDGALVGVLGLVAGVSGALAANAPRRVDAFRKLDLVMVGAAVLETVLGFVGGLVVWPAMALAILGVVALVCALRANQEAQDR